MVDYRTEGNIAVLEVNYPPVNALGFKTRTGIAGGLEKANKDREISAIVICGKGQTFPAGADITEFASGGFSQGPNLTAVCNALEASNKPVVAAVHGTALGGGCEVAISCHYRVVDSKARFGFPEVDLGILPAATGTQRFPRLAGLKAALEIIPTCKQFGVKEAQKFGMVDKISSNDLVRESIEFARTIAGKPFEDRRTSKKSVKGADNAVALKEAAMARCSSKQKGLLAPIYAIKAVMASVEQPTFEAGLEKEQEFSVTLFTSGQARALQYAFFSQRAATKWSLGAANHQNTKPRPLKRGAVIGAGTMGTGIAMAMLNAGLSVILLEQDKKFLDKGVKTLRDLYSGSVRVGALTEKQAKANLDRLTPSLQYSDLKDVDIVVEAVFENTDIKKQVFAQLDKVCRRGAVLATNTSWLNIDEIASATSRPEDVIGTHFFVPAYYMKLLENVRGAKTSAETIATAQQFGRRIGKVPVLVGNCHGFVGNRMLKGYSTEAVFMVEEGALPEQVDEVLENFGMPIGPLKVGDLSGLDIGWRGRKEIAKRTDQPLDVTRRFWNGERYCGIADMLCEAGRFGRKTGAGYYRYEKPGAKVPYPDAYFSNLVENYCKEKGVVRRSIPPQEILERCLYSLINEGFKVLEDGIATKPQDIDTVWLLGYGWPRQTGGPMFYADTVGVKNVYDRICHYYKQHPTSSHWQPSDLLRRIAEFNIPMSGWMQQIPSRL